MPSESRNLEQWQRRLEEMKRCKRATELVRAFGEPNHKVLFPETEIWHYTLGIADGFLYSIHASMTDTQLCQIYMHMEPANDEMCSPKRPWWTILFQRARFIDFVIGMFGRGRATLGEWPHREVVQTAMDTIRDCGGKIHHKSGTPAGELEVLHFRIHGRGMRLCIVDYGAVSLWGPKGLVADISKRVALRLSATGPRTLLNSVPKNRAALLESWGWQNPDAAIAHSLRTELQREVPPGHLLFRRPVDVVAYREDQDDVLCRHQDEPDRFTVVHLTWSRKREIDVDHPSVCFDGKFEAFFAAEQTYYERSTS